MTLDPAFAGSVLRQGESRLGGYELTANEQARLLAVVRQPGMSVNCTLARANRFAPIADAFPLTCSLLKPHLRPLLDELWSFHRPDGYQLGGEADAFAGFLRQKVASGEMNYSYAEEVFRYECAAWDLIRLVQRSVLGPVSAALEDRQVTVWFAHDPRILIPSLERDELPPPDLPAGNYLVHLILRGDSLEVEMAD